MKKNANPFSRGISRDYAKSMAWHDDLVLKRSTRRGLVGFLLGLFSILALLVVFFSFKTALFANIHQKIDKASIMPPEKIKPLKKSVKVKAIPRTQHEYGFYTILPNVEVKSAHHDEETKAHALESSN